MLKNILNLKGTHLLSKKEQNTIFGGERTCYKESGNVGSYTGPYIACFNDDGTIDYYDILGKKIPCY